MNNLKWWWCQNYCNRNTYTEASQREWQKDFRHQAFDFSLLQFKSYDQLTHTMKFTFTSQVSVSVFYLEHTGMN